MKTYTLLKLIRNCHSIARMKAMQGDIKMAIDMFQYEAVALIHCKGLEDAFDLDCNPSRDDEREANVVNLVSRQPMVVGDVLIDNKTGIFYCCDVRGWSVHDSFSYDMPQMSGRLPACKPIANFI